MKTTKEYPAGHSVDTEWFAIDKDGHLGALFADYETPVPIQVRYEMDVSGHETSYEEVLKKMAKHVEGPLFELFLPPSIIKGILDYLRDPRYEPDHEGSHGLFQLKEGVDVHDLQLWKDIPQDRDDAFIIHLSKTERLFCFEDNTDCGWDLPVADITNGSVVVLKDCSFPEALNALGVYSFDSDGWMLYAYDAEAVQPAVPFSAQDCEDADTSDLLRLNCSFPSNPCIEPYKDYCCFYYNHETSCIAEDKVKIEGMKTMKGKEALLFKAIDEQDETMVAMLLEMYGLSPLARNSDGLTALAYAESHVVQAGQEDYHVQYGLPDVAGMLEMVAKRDYGYQTGRG